MAVRDILRMGDARLLQTAAAVDAFDTPALHALVADLHDTVRAASGAGLAAPQIGVGLRVIVFGSTVPNPRYPRRPLVPPTVLVNPVLEPLGDEETDDWEGCLSIPGLRGLVPRPARIRYRGFDAHGNAVEREADGFHARVVQHELDHLNGTLYPMRMRDFAQFGFDDVLSPELMGAAAPMPALASKI